MNNKELNKLFRAYYKAEHDLIQVRNELFPPGTVVQCSLWEGATATVIPGSLYPHQINTDSGHMAWQFATKV